MRQEKTHIHYYVNFSRLRIAISEPKILTPLTTLPPIRVGVAATISHLAFFLLTQTLPLSFSLRVAEYLFPYFHSTEFGNLCVVLVGVCAREYISLVEITVAHGWWLIRTTVKYVAMRHSRERVGKVSYTMTFLSLYFGYGNIRCLPNKWMSRAPNMHVCTCAFIHGARMLAINKTADTWDIIHM